MTDKASDVDDDDDVGEEEKPRGRKSRTDDDDDDDEDTSKSSDGDGDEDEDEDELSADDDQIEAAIEFTKNLVANADEWVKNYDPDDGITLAQASAAVFTKFKGKGALKGVVASVVSNAKFHEKYAKEGGWEFDEEEGVIKPAKKKRKKK